jgi:acetylornithine/succinyldiaminopimelate/putrescine aminotransferase
VEPNDAAGLEGAFRRHGPRAAAFWAEPVMMNREAILVAPEFLRLGRRLCTEHGALMIVDEIQTGFWYPEVFLFRRAGIMPDVVVIGKGMTAGFHPLAGLLFRHELDILDQYDAINTNGQATLPALVSLASLDRIQREAAGLRRRAEAHERELAGLVRAFPDALESWNGSGFLTGLRFRRRETALAFHKAAVQRGLWLRAHAYHEGHRTVLMKLPLAFTDASLRFLHGALRDLLATVPTP